MSTEQLDEPVGLADEGFADAVEEAEHSDGLFAEDEVLTPHDDTVQWRAALLQLVNWGGFSGLTTVPLRGDATMISGASGVGKSTILDAYTALMMPSDTKFNGASNDAVAGRARSVGQRNLLSYLRGAVDVVDNPRTGRPEEQLLRGKGSDTWGAIAMTFVNDQGGRFTALRTYYVPRRATRSADVQMALLTHEGTLDLATLELAVPERFHANALKKLFGGIRVHRTYAEFSSVLHARLGIGANGDGAKALRLLARIQAGNQVRSVDELYKDMVLERPATYAAADRAIEHFDDLDAAYVAMRTEEKKLEVLEPITELHERRTRAVQRMAQLDSFGVTKPQEVDTPLRMFLLRTHLRLLENAVSVNRAARASTSDELTAATSSETSLVADLESAKEAHRAAGGSTLADLGSRLEQEQVVREDRLSRRAKLEERLLPLLESSAADTIDVDDSLASAEAFAALQEMARGWLGQWQDERARLKAARDRALEEKFPISQRRSELRRERASLEGRAGRVPVRLDELRSEVAAASGLSVEELPFLAELIDVAPEEARWRTAIDTVLGASARTMLVPADKLAGFSRAIDSLRLKRRITFEGVELDLPGSGPADPERIAGKLVFKDSRFSGWVQSHVAEPSRNALCVEDAAGLDGGGYRVTLSGQTRNGRRGTHGRNDARSIIGFSNVDAIDDLERELDQLERRLGEVDGSVAELDRQVSVLEHRRLAYDAVATARFDDFDVSGSDRRIAELGRRRRAILDSDDKLEVLQQQIEELGDRTEEIRRARFILDQRRLQLNAEHAALVDQEDEARDRLDAMDEAGRVVLTEEQSAALAADFAAAAAPADPDDLERFTESAHRLGERLRGAVAEAETEAQRAEEELTGIFRVYKMQWDSPNLGATVDSYGDFARILDQIRATGLADRRTEWRRRLTEWSGQDLVPLVGAMAASVEEIEDRLEPINAILRRLEFGASGQRLRIRLRRLAPAQVQAFMKDLRHLSREVGSDLAEADLEKRFNELSRFMTQLRKPEHAVGVSERDRLLDVR
ncbi:uncharacterized protein YPO0396, partial [Nocardioides daedukensis]